jgi:hypothetical protein
MQTLRRLSVHVGIGGAKVNEKETLEKQDDCQLSYETVRAIKKHVDTHIQRASCRDEMTGDDGMIGENRRWWP